MTPDELLDAVEAWHDHGTGDLWDWLGWTEAEYGHWVETREQPSRDAP